jgi:hypothetical protein
MAQQARAHRPPRRHWRCRGRVAGALALLLPLLAGLGGAAGAAEAQPWTCWDCREDVRTPAELGIPASVDCADGAAIEVDARLARPDGANAIQPCFWLVPQEPWSERSWSTVQKAVVPWERFRAQAAGRWCLRFAPDIPGPWRWSYLVRLPGAPARELPGGELQAAPGAPGAGIIRLGPQGGLVTGDGQPYIPVGINCAWPDEGGSAQYAGWLQQLSAAGGNATRLWLVHYFGGTAPEWSQSQVNDGYHGLGRYSQESGARVDRILQEASRLGVRVMLSLWTFGDFSADWNDNPYAVGGGGFLAHPQEFFTDARAQEAARRLLRYAIARWGAYRSLWAWELWNEVDNCDAFADGPVAAWHHAMALTIRGLDSHHHLITTSYRFPPPGCACSAFADPALDLAQLHAYLPELLATLRDGGVRLAIFHKPWLAGEAGLSVSPDAIAADPTGLHLHDALWAGLFAGSCGGAMPWWWDVYVDRRSLWRHCQGAARFTQGESLATLAEVAARTDQVDTQVLARADRQRLWAWVHTPRRVVGDPLGISLTRYARDAVPAASAITIDHGRAGWWHVTWYDTYDGSWLGEAAVHEPSGTRLHLPLPPYRDEVALKAEWSASAPAVRAGPPAPTPWHDALEAAGR